VPPHRNRGRRQLGLELSIAEGRHDMGRVPAQSPRQLLVPLSKLKHASPPAAERPTISNADALARVFTTRQRHRYPVPPPRRDDRRMATAPSKDAIAVPLLKRLPVRCSGAEQARER